MRIEDFKDYEIYDDYLSVDKDNEMLFGKYAYPFMEEIMNAKYLTHCLKNNFEIIRSQRLLDEAMEYPNIQSDNIIIKEFEKNMDEFVKSYYLIAKNYTNLNFFMKIEKIDTYRILSGSIFPRYLYIAYYKHPNQNIKNIYSFEDIIEVSTRMLFVCDDTLFLNSPTKKSDNGAGLLNIGYISNGCVILGNPFKELLCNKINKINNSGSTLELFSKEGEE